MSCAGARSVPCLSPCRDSTRSRHSSSTWPYLSLRVSCYFHDAPYTKHPILLTTHYLLLTTDTKNPIRPPSTAMIAFSALLGGRIGFFVSVGLGAALHFLLCASRPYMCPIWSCAHVIRVHSSHLPASPLRCATVICVVSTSERLCQRQCVSRADYSIQYVFAGRVTFISLLVLRRHVHVHGGWTWGRVSHCPGVLSSDKVALFCCELK